MSFSTRLVRSAPFRRAGGLLFSRGSSAVVASRAPFATFARMNLATRGLASMAGGAHLKELAEANPYKDVVRYEHKNRKWNLNHVDFYSEALAIGLLENGLQPGDVVLSWLPEHLSESVSKILDLS